MPTCQILPPNFPGYEPYCPYTAGADSDDTKWTGVDLTKAKDLVKQSGTSGAKVVVVGTTDEVGKALALQMVSDLKAIGYNASAKLLASGPQYPTSRTPTTTSRSAGRPGTRTIRQRRTS